MREITSTGDSVVDNQFLVRYNSNEIPDSPTSKVVLYACKTYAEFKHKLKIYVKIFNVKFRIVSSFQNSASMSCTKRYNSKPASDPTHSKSEKNLKNKDIIWYSCSKRPRIFRHCPNLHLGPKCRICLNFGYKYNSCPNKPIPRAPEEKIMFL